MADMAQTPSPNTLEEYFNAFQGLKETQEVRLVLARNLGAFFYSVNVLTRPGSKAPAIQETGETPAEAFRKAWAVVQPKIGKIFHLQPPA